jgi:hypothetical protein
MLHIVDFQPMNLEEQTKDCMHGLDAPERNYG